MSGPGGVIQKKGRRISNGQRGIPQWLGSSPEVEDGASQGARSSLALDWRWPLPQPTERIGSMHSVNGSVPRSQRDQWGRSMTVTHLVGFATADYFPMLRPSRGRVRRRQVAA